LDFAALERAPISELELGYFSRSFYLLISAVTALSASAFAQEFAFSSCSSQATSYSILVRTPFQGPHSNGKEISNPMVWIP